MRKRLLFLSLFFVLVCSFLSVVYSDGLLQEYHNSGDDGYILVYGVNWSAQGFVASGTHTVSSVKLRLYKHEHPRNFTVSLRMANSSGQPSGSDLRSAMLDGDDFTSNSAGLWYEFVFSSPYTINDGYKFAIVARLPEGNATDYVNWRVKNVGAYGAGIGQASSDSGVHFTDLTTQDFMFEVWGGSSGSSGVEWIDVPLFVQFVVLFLVCGFPAVVLGVAGAKDGWGLQGLLLGLLLGMGGGVMVGIVPFWMVFLVGMFLLLFLLSLARRS